MPIPLDLNGPCAQPFEAWPDQWVQEGLVSRFNAVVAAMPDRVALDDGTRRMRYAALAAAAGSLGARIDADCRPGAIGIMLPQSADFWIAILACRMAGRSYVGLDLHHPPGRNAGILRDAGLAAVIMPAGVSPDPSVVPDELPILGWDFSSDAAAPAQCDLPQAADDAPAVVLYTSGSTGTPKGIANSEAALLQRVAQYVNACHLHADDRLLTVSSPCTIAGTREGLTALLIGATLHVIDAQHAGLGDIMRVIRDARITVFNSVPSVLRALADGQPDAAGALRSLRIVRIGGEVVFWTDIALFRRVLPADCHIQIGYSSTEATGTQWFVPRDAMPSGPFVPVGYVLPGNLASVLDETGRALPPHEVGELLLRSRYIALGTWRDGRVADRMPSDPQDPKARLLHTGDLVHVDADGVCTVVGRKDRQVKINGVRVEPAEVEAALRSLPQIADAAVIARRTDKAMSLAAFVVPRQPELHHRRPDPRGPAQDSATRSEAGPRPGGGGRAAAAQREAGHARPGSAGPCRG